MHQAHVFRSCVFPTMDHPNTNFMIFSLYYNPLLIIILFHSYLFPIHVSFQSCVSEEP
jgi:hypothetical protein